MKKKSIGIIAVSVLCAFAIFAGAMFAHQYFDAKNSEDSFDELTDLIVDVPDETAPETDNSESTELSPEKLAAQEQNKQGQNARNCLSRTMTLSARLLLTAQM